MRRLIAFWSLLVVVFLAGSAPAWALPFWSSKAKKDAQRASDRANRRAAIQSARLFFWDGTRESTREAQGRFYDTRRKFPWKSDQPAPSFERHDDRVYVSPQLGDILVTRTVKDGREHLTIEGKGLSKDRHGEKMGRRLAAAERKQITEELIARGVVTANDFVGSADAPARVRFATHTREDALRAVDPKRYWAERDAANQAADAQREATDLEETRAFFRGR
jgi:hypothetical protein